MTVPRNNKDRFDVVVEHDTRITFYNDVIVIYPKMIPDTPNTASCTNLNILAKPGHIAWMCRKGDIECSEGALLSSVRILHD